MPQQSIALLPPPLPDIRVGRRTTNLDQFLVCARKPSYTRTIEDNTVILAELKKNPLLRKAFSRFVSDLN